MTKVKKNEFGEIVEKCTYYNGNKKCAFHGQSQCIWDGGMVPVMIGCIIESRMEYEAMFGGQDE